MAIFYLYNIAMTNTKQMKSKFNTLNVNIINLINFFGILKYNNGALLLSLHLKKTVAYS